MSLNLSYRIFIVIDYGNRKKNDNGVKYKTEKGIKLFLNVDKDKCRNNSNCKTILKEKIQVKVLKFLNLDNLIEQTKTK